MVAVAASTYNEGGGARRTVVPAPAPQQLSNGSQQEWRFWSREHRP